MAGSSGTTALRTLACCLLVGLAGCAGATVADTPAGTTSSTTAPTATTTATAVTTAPPTATTPGACTESGNWIRLSPVEEGELENVSAEEVVRYGNLSASRRRAVRRSVEWDCAVRSTAWRFGGDHPSVVVYEGRRYALYVGVRTATTTTTPTTTGRAATTGTTATTGA